MGFASFDSYAENTTVYGRRIGHEGNKITTPAHTAGGWHLLAGLAGFPNATTFPSAQDLVFQSCTDLGGDSASASVFSVQHGGIVDPGTKHLVSGSISCVAAAGAPWIFKLVDVQAYYRLSTTNVTGTGSRVLINSNTFTASSSSGLLATYTNDFNTYSRVKFTTSGTLPTGLNTTDFFWTVRVSATTCRYATSLANALSGTVVPYTDAGTGTHTMQMHTRTGGIECDAFFVVQTAPTAGGPTMSASAYDSPVSSFGAGTRAFQASPTFGAAADAYATRIPHTGNAAGRYPLLPRQGGDTGVARVNSFTLSGGVAYTGSGVMALVIAKPLATLYVPATGVLTEREFASQMPSFPKIDDGACLAWMMFSTAATTNNSPVTTTLNFAWNG